MDMLRGSVGPPLGVCRELIVTPRMNWVEKNDPYGYLVSMLGLGWHGAGVQGAAQGTQHICGAHVVSAPTKFVPGSPGCVHGRASP